MSEPMRLTISEIRRETAEAATFVFDDPHRDVGGVSGQHVVVRVAIDGQEHRRVFSLSSSPELGQAPSITVKRLPGGIVSTYFVERVTVGEMVEVEPAAGVFQVGIATENNRTYFAFMAGSGSVPVLSIVRTVLAKEPGSTCHVAYGNRTEGDVIFSGELGDLVAANPGRLTVTHVLSGAGDRIDHRFVNDYLMVHPPTSLDVRYLVSGPPGMNDVVVARLRSLGIMDVHVMVEHYLPPTREDSPVPYHGAIVRVEGSDETVEVPGGETILAALTRGEAPVVYACQSGVCGTCRAELVSGDVDEGLPFVLSDEERHRGVILTCVSRPLSAEVVVRLLG